jgi:Helix-turn-helix domain
MSSARLRFDQCLELNGMTADPVLTIAEVALDLRCSRAHVHNAINGKLRGVSALPAITMGRRKLVRRASLERWKRENERGGPGPDILAGSPKVDAAGRA